MHLPTDPPPVRPAPSGAAASRRPRRVLRAPLAGGAVPVLAGVALTLAGCDGGSPAEPRPDETQWNAAHPGYAGHPASLPFDATMIIRQTSVSFPGAPGYPARCPIAPFTAAGEAAGGGHGSHLGRFTETESVCVDLATLEFGLGQFVMTAANGDELRGTFQGQGVGAPPTARLLCTFALTGGTGRFASARGGGECVDSRQLGDGTSRIRFVGRIVYEAADRSP